MKKTAKKIYRRLKMNGNDNYDEDLEWDAWVDEAYQEYQTTHPTKGSSNNLPAKLPKTKKTRKVSKHNKFQLPLDWDYRPKNKSEKMKEELKRLQEEKMLRRAEAAKKISWKEISKNTEYEILVGGTSLGRVRQNFQGKWKIHPVFRWKKNSYNRRVIVEGDYLDFHESGKALVDLWMVS